MPKFVSVSTAMVAVPVPRNPLAGGAPGVDINVISSTYAVTDDGKVWELNRQAGGLDRGRWIQMTDVMQELPPIPAEKLDA